MESSQCPDAFTHRDGAFLRLGLPGSGEYGPLRWVAVVLFVLAIYTDKLDGDIARARGLITSFGKIADPIADKLLIGSALIMLSAVGELWWWITIVMLVREVGITLLRFVVIRYGVMAASKGGKLKTVMQTVAIFFFLLPVTPAISWLSIMALAIMLAALAVTVVTGADYLYKAGQLVGSRRGTSGSALGEG